MIGELRRYVVFSRHFTWPKNNYREHVVWGNRLRAETLARYLVSLGHTVEIRCDADAKPPEEAKRLIVTGFDRSG